MVNRFFKKTILLIAGFLLVYPLLAWVAGRMDIHANVSYIPANYGHLGHRLAEADTLSGSNSPTLLFIGSSHCYRTFDTRYYNSPEVKAFNLGSSNQTPVQSLYLLQRYIDRWPLEMAVIEVHPDIMCNSGDESTVDLLSNSRIDMNMALMALRQKNIRVFNTMLCSLVDHTLPCGLSAEGDLTVRIPSDGDTILFTYRRGGYVELSPHCWNVSDIEPIELSINERQVNALKECVELLRSRNIPCLLLEVPSTKNLYSAYTNHAVFEDSVDFNPELNSLLGIGLNLNENDELKELLDDSTCFFDEDHLNEKGIAIVNNWLTTKITKLLDRRNAVSSH